MTISRLKLRPVFAGTPGFASAEEIAVAGQTVSAMECRPDDGNHDRYLNDLWVSPLRGRR
jgi:hypothetical protein